MSTGSLYQFYTEKALKPGDYVAVNGTWDQYGVVINSKRDLGGNYLNLIRGVPKKEYQIPVAQF